jgi:hypothetical protein
MLEPESRKLVRFVRVENASSGMDSPGMLEWEWLQKLLN